MLANNSNTSFFERYEFQKGSKSQRVAKYVFNIQPSLRRFTEGLHPQTEIEHVLCIISKSSTLFFFKVISLF